MELITLYNWYQANKFLEMGATLVSIGLNEETRKIKFIFLKNEKFDNIMKKWRERTL